MREIWSKWIVLPLAASLLFGCREVGSDTPGASPLLQNTPAETTPAEAVVTLPPVDIPALRAEILKRVNFAPPPPVHSQQFTVFNGVSTETVPANGNSQPPQPIKYSEIITEGVIEDYVTIIRFMDARAKRIAAIPRASDPDAPSVLDVKTREASRIILHNYRSPTSRAPFVMTSPGKDPITFWNMCHNECPKLILENYTESVAYVTHDFATGEIIPESIIEYRLSKTCNELSYGSPAMGLCINGKTPNDAETITKGTGLHVYDKAASPFWPREFSPDMIPMTHPYVSTYTLAPAFEDLSHVKASNRTKHRALGFKSAGKVEELYIDNDYSCVTIHPPIFGESLSYLVTEVIGENSAIEAGASLRQSNICIGQKPENDDEKFFQTWETQSGNFDYSAAISPHDISRNLTATYWKDPEKNGGQVKKAIIDLQRFHPEFQNRIGYDVAPIVIDLAKRDLGVTYHNNTAFKILQKMPHESMAAYAGELAQIVEVRTDKIGCLELKCPKDLNGNTGKLSKLAEVFNGAGANAAEYLDQIYLANKSSDGRSWWGPIGGLHNAAACVGNMGPELERAITGQAYGRTFVSDNNFTFHAEQSLKMTSQSEKARQYIEDKLAWMIKKSQDPEMKPSWARTQGLMRSIDRAEKILEEWTDQEPFCPSRPKVP